MNTQIRQVLPRINVGVLVSGALFFSLYLLLTILSPAAGSSYSVNNFTVLMTTLAIAAVGTTLVLITGGFDLSVAGVISITNVLAATQMQKYPDQAWLIAGLIVLLGLAVGMVNGYLVAFLGLQSLGVTLGTYIALSGLALVILSAPGGLIPITFSTRLTSQVGNVPLALLVLISLAAMWLVFVRTRTGITAFAMGDDRVGARMSGLHIRSVELTCYALAGALYAMAGLFLSAVTASGDPNSGTPFLLTAFAAMALGLVSFRGGHGSAIAVIFGAATLMVIPKLLFAIGLADFWVGAVQGFVILIALSVPLLAARVVKATRRPDGPHEPVNERVQVDASTRR